MQKIIISFFLLTSLFLFAGKHLVNAQGITSPPIIIPTISNQANDPQRELQRLNNIWQSKEGQIGGACIQKRTVQIQVPQQLVTFATVFLPPGFNYGAMIISGFVTNALNFILDNTVNPFLTQIVNLPSNFFQMKLLCSVGKPSNPQDPSKCICTDDRNLNATRLCGNIAQGWEKGECMECMKEGGGAWTAFGCFYSDLPKLIKERVFGFGIGLAGIIALLCIIYSAFILQTSQGNPEKIKKAQELLTSCIMGLMLIIFSIFILKIIGVDILKIPGFRSS